MKSCDHVSQCLLTAQATLLSATSRKPCFLFELVLISLTYLILPVTQRDRLAPLHLRVSITTMANLPSPIRRYFLPAILILLHIFIFVAVWSSKQFANLRLEGSSVDDRNSRVIHARDTATPGDVISVAEAKEWVAEAKAASNSTKKKFPTMVELLPLGNITRLIYNSMNASSSLYSNFSSSQFVTSSTTNASTGSTQPGFITNSSSPFLKSKSFSLSSSVRNQTVPGLSLFNISSSQSLHNLSSTLSFSSDSLPSAEITDTETNSTRSDIINLDSPEMNLSATYRVERIAGVNGNPGPFSQTATVGPPDLLICK